MKEIVQYETVDGKVFNSKEEAIKHEESLDLGKNDYIDSDYDFDFLPEFLHLECVNGHFIASDWEEVMIDSSVFLKENLPSVDNHIFYKLLVDKRIKLEDRHRVESVKSIRKGIYEITFKNKKTITFDAFKIEQLARMPDQFKGIHVDADGYVWVDLTILDSYFMLNPFDLYEGLIENEKWRKQDEKS